MSRTTITSSSGRIIGFVSRKGERTKRKCDCGAPAEVMCDFPLRGAKAGQTCGALLCADCAWRVHLTAQGPIHYCAMHRMVYEASRDQGADK